MRHLWDSYWAWAGGNIGAMPLQGLIVYVLRGPVGRLLSGPALKEAEAARRIAADLYAHHTGRTHPDDPGRSRTPPDTEGEAR